MWQIIGMRFGLGLVAMGIVLFGTISLPARFYGPESRTYQEAKQPAVTREATFSHRKPMWTIAAGLVTLGLASMGISRIGARCSSSWRSNRKI